MIESTSSPPAHLDPSLGKGALRRPFFGPSFLPQHYAIVTSLSGLMVPASGECDYRHSRTVMHRESDAVNVKFTVSEESARKSAKIC